MKEKIKQFLHNPKSHYCESGHKGFDFDSRGYANGSGRGCGFTAVEGCVMNGDGYGDGEGYAAGYCINGRGGNMERRYGGIKYIQLKED